ncbi:hypothetical protein [Hoeflea sp.]|uniref:hypothetical protein n=1 Tax=Hoeflea sp. TaxID=1940281 RepID=UPI003B02AEA7
MGEFSPGTERCRMVDRTSVLEAHSFVPKHRRPQKAPANLVILDCVAGALGNIKNKISGLRNDIWIEPEKNLFAVTKSNIGALLLIKTNCFSGEMYIIQGSIKNYIYFLFSKKMCARINITA